MKKIWQDMREWLRHPNWAWTMRHVALVAGIASLASWFFGLGVDKLLDFLESAHKSEEGGTLGWMAGFIVAAALLALAAHTARKGRDRMLRTNGTAFVVMEKADDWREFNHDNFYKEARKRFARLVEVPVLKKWGWPMDDRARYWEERFAELLASFRALYRAETEQTDGSPATATGIFMTAPQPAAMALGYRFRAAVTDMDLGVWPRPSHVREGKVPLVFWDQRAHHYESLDRLPQPGTVAVREEHLWDVSLTVDRSKTDPGIPVPPVGGPVSLLLIRFGRKEWAELPGLSEDYGKPSAAASSRLEAPGPVEMKLQDMAGVVPLQGTTQVQLHELRIVQAGGFFSWEDSPYLVNEAVEWILRKTEKLRGHTLFLATKIPNDVAVGIGLAAGQPSCVGWPKDLWPIVHCDATDTRIVPDLNLGRFGGIKPGA